MRRVNLAGKTAVVTGGNRGIGLAIVRRLAEAGARVRFTARDAARAEAAMAELAGLDGASPVVCDVTDRRAMAELLAEPVDILINNAGVIGPIGRIADVDAQDWARNIGTNLVAAFHATQLALRGMQHLGGGTIVHLSSGAAFRPQEGWSAYCAGKAGLAMLTRSVHLEYGGAGIRVFGLAPGVVDTGMQGEIRASGINPVSQIPRAALASTDEASYCAIWLCTAEAAPFIGQEVDVRSDVFRRAAGLAVG
jgi:NAD(P)-dependent dehydrogenase (short-subunit alcohol dehydrogenase family)